MGHQMGGMSGVRQTSAGVGKILLNIGNLGPLTTGHTVPCPPMSPWSHGTRDIPPSSPDDAGDTFLFSCLSSLIVSTSSGCRAVYGSVWKCMAVTNGWVTRAGNQTLHQSWERRGGLNTADTRTHGTQGFNDNLFSLI